MKKPVLLLLIFTGLSACNLIKKDKDAPPTPGFNLMTIEQDKELGMQVNNEILANPAQYPILDPVLYKEVYDYINGIKETILNTGEVQHAKDFAWEIRIIDDTTLNAFCTPGGYIYFYTGILKFMDSEDELAGVLGHEIAHADLRHSTSQLTKMYGLSVILSFLAGDNELAANITASLIGLSFSRTHESEADYNSVKYLCKTPYNAAGGAGFFEKILSLGGAQMPEFLSTHPNPDNRIEGFKATQSKLGCAGKEEFQSRYKAVMSKLP